MGKPTGFKEFRRQTPSYAPVRERISHFNEFSEDLSDKELQNQGARCMDCGIPFCHGGCPVDNIIPDWNHMAFQGRWREGLQNLHSTNNFPEFTGRVCPAPCEAACTLNLTDEPVSIKTIEYALVEKGWNEGWIRPQIPITKTGKRVAVIGAGPAGLAASQQLARAGHSVVLFEKNSRFGGLLRYGIPDFKLEKWIIDRRISQMQAEGVEFRPNTNVGVDITAKQLLKDFDAVVLSGGSEKPRDLPIEGRDLKGVHFAMDFLSQQNKRNADETINVDEILASGKNVLVIGGGDTGSDCVGTSIRQSANSVKQIEIMPKPPEKENKGTTWPNWPNKLRSSSSHEEGCERDWNIISKKFIGKNCQVSGVEAARVEWKQDDKGNWNMEEVAGSEFFIHADLVFLAMGFVHPVQEGLLNGLGVEYDGRGNVKAEMDVFKTSVDKVFAAGDMRRGQSLVVWAIREGRACAKAVDEYLMGESTLAGY
ncbi:MAG: glutamate synthase subunit beta [Rhodospirillales bacterium]|nr:glutamate synthase subunit beta [Rhodospirillales bacterium]